MQRCTDTIRIHSESVFTLQVNNNWSTVYSAGKDRKIWATDLHNPGNSTLIGEETDPVLKVFVLNIEIFFVCKISIFPLDSFMFLQSTYYLL
ncbi:unnamed protein product [Schistosoma margrebowiei]|uniref:Uncharacterized protein n=1 Tax=Schistosoma margrebowiei TaxID=48269 RepID=A0A183NCR6_9TREM|nr:unnamed protein product [Schistosoma margrebowiei]